MHTVRVRAFALLLGVILGAVGVGNVAESASTTPVGWQIQARPPLVRVPPEGPCPRSIARFHDVQNAVGDLRGHLLPDGALFGIVCRYGTSRAGQPYALVTKSLINGRTARDFQAAIAGIRTSKPTGVTSCPGDSSTASVLSFGYADGSYVDLWYHDTGCRTLDNGYLEAFEPGNPAFYNRYEPIVDNIAPLTR